MVRIPYQTDLLNETLEVGDSGARFIGVVWLALPVRFGISTSGLWRGSNWALLATALLAAGSLVECVLGMPEATLGILINHVILGGVTYVAREQRSTNDGPPIGHQRGLAASRSAVVRGGRRRATASTGRRRRLPGIAGH
jgi:hypothetical protein